MIDKLLFFFLKWLGHAVDQAIPLLFLQEDGQIKLNKEDLRIIAQHPDVRDNPVAVLSINADPETLFHHQKPKGIGNLLNFLLIFLESTMVSLKSKVWMKFKTGHMHAVNAVTMLYKVRMKSNEPNQEIILFKGA